jgi:hypothetical protein
VAFKNQFAPLLETFVNPFVIAADAFKKFKPTVMKLEIE